MTMLKALIQKEVFCYMQRCTLLCICLVTKCERLFKEHLEHTLNNIISWLPLFWKSLNSTRIRRKSGMGEAHQSRGIFLSGKFRITVTCTVCLKKCACFVQCVF